MNKKRKLFSGIRDVIYRLRFKTFSDPLNNGIKLTLTFNYLKWYFFYKYFGIKYKITLQNNLQSWVYPYPDHDAGEANIFTKNVDFIDNDFIRNNLNKGEYIVDAGCNVGNRTLVLSDIIAGALMIDPNPIALQRVKENLALNNLELSNFDFVEKAVGEFTDTKKFSNFGGASTQNMILEQDECSSGSFTITEVTTIDKELAMLKISPSFIKIDVEGYDFNTIKGSINTLKSGSVRLLKFENNNKEIVCKIVDFFSGINWEVFALDSNGVGSKDKSLLSLRDNLFASPTMGKLKY